MTTSQARRAPEDVAPLDLPPELLDWLGDDVHEFVWCLVCNQVEFAAEAQP